MNSIVREDQYERNQGDECPWMLPAVDSPPNWSTDDGHDCKAQEPVNHAVGHVRNVHQEHP